MIVLAQNKKDQTFIVGMSLNEYFEQIKPFLENNNFEMFDESLIIKEYENNLKNNKEEKIFGLNYIYEVYILIKKDLSSCCLINHIHQKILDKSFENYYACCIIHSINEINDIPFNDINIDIVIGDITDEETDAVVNAANKNLQEGAGVCGAIFAAAGNEQLQRTCDALAPIKTGNAVITPGFNLRAKYIIHAVGPKYKDESSARYLKDAYINSLKLAEQYNLESISFPSISTGIYGYPKDKASAITVDSLLSFDYKKLNRVKIVCYDKNTYDYYNQALLRSQEKLFNKYKEEFKKTLEDLFTKSSIKLTIKYNGEIIESPSIKIKARTGEAILMDSTRHLNYIRTVIPHYNYSLTNKVLEELTKEQFIIYCEGDEFEGDYTFVISKI